MRRSHRALLERRASGKLVGDKNYLCKVSLSVFFVLWGLFFLLSSLISHSDGYRDESAMLGAEISISNEENIGSCQLSGSLEKNPLEEIASVHSVENFCTNSAETGNSHDELLGSEENTNSVFVSEQPEANSGSDVKSETNCLKNNRLSHSVPIGLDEFKSRAFNSKSKSGTDHSGGVIHRLDPGGKEYNYASASKGAKVMACNKEAKGASNVLGKDKDKYLRNPCSAEEKYVIMELSEETLVDTIAIANFEHYSSNLKDFELLGSLSYPTETWIRLGNFTAANVKHEQRFTHQELQWVRYLKLNLLGHYGAEFYCTLSFVEVFGVDAVEWMVEDLFMPEEENGEQKQFPSRSESVQIDDCHQESCTGIGSGLSVENSNGKQDIRKKVPDPVAEIRQQPGGRMPGDSVLKILMQKVRSQDLSLSVLERYLEEVNFRYGNIFKGFDSDLEEKDTLLEKIGFGMKDLHVSWEAIAKDVDDLQSWKSVASRQLDNLMEDNFALRSVIERVQKSQISMESKGMAVFFVSFIFGSLAFVRLLIDILQCVYMAISMQRTGKSGKFCWMRVLLLFICSVITLILSLEFATSPCLNVIVSSIGRLAEL